MAGLFTLISSGIILWLDGRGRGRGFWNGLGVLTVIVLTAGARTAEIGAAELGFWPLLGAILPAVVVELHVLFTRVRRFSPEQRGAVVRFDASAVTADSEAVMAPFDRRAIFAVRWLTGAFTYFVVLLGAQAVLAFNGYVSAW